MKLDIHGMNNLFFIINNINCVANKLSDEGLSKLSKSFKINTTLTELNLNCFF